MKKDPITAYCESVGMPRCEFAAAIERSSQLLCDFRAGRCGLSDATKKKIISYTGGKITLEALTDWPDRARTLAA